MSRIIFMGTPDFALASLKALVDGGHDVVAVYTAPPRPKGRGWRETLSTVHAFANERGLPVRCPISLKSAEEAEIFKSHEADLAIVAAYGLLLPKRILEAPRLGCVNVHASLLPRWRGAAPIQRAIEAGDAETGVTLMAMDEGLDTGAILAKASVAIDPRETGETLLAKLRDLGAESLARELPGILSGKTRRVAQASEGAVYAPKLRKEESFLDVSLGALELERKLRAFTPWPGAHLPLDNEPLRILKATALLGFATPLASGWFKNARGELFFACKDGALRVDELRKAGSKPVTAADFLNGYRGQGMAFSP